MVNPRISELGMTRVGKGLNAGAFLCYDSKKRVETRLNVFVKLTRVKFYNTRNVLRYLGKFI